MINDKKIYSLTWMCFLGVFLIVTAVIQAGESIAIINQNTGTTYGASDLQLAIDEANPGDTLNLNDNTTFSGPFTINKSLALQGAIGGRNYATLDGASAVRVLYIDGTHASKAFPVVVNLNNLSIQNGLATRLNSPDFGGNGGGILVSGAEVSGNLFELPVTVTLNMNSVEVQNNQASETGGGIALVYSAANFVDCTIQNNQAPLAAGVNCLCSDCVVTSCDIASNTQGSGIVSCGSSSPITLSFLTLTNSTIQLNTSTSQGGGLYNSYVSYAQCEDTSFRENTAASNGGGIYNFCILDTKNIEIQNNISNARGGGVYNSQGFSSYFADLAAGSISGNSATSLGGGIYNASTAKGLVFTNCDPKKAVVDNTPDNIAPKDAFIVE